MDKNHQQTNETPNSASPSEDDDIHAIKKDLIEFLNVQNDTHVDKFKDEVKQALDELDLA